MTPTIIFQHQCIIIFNHTKTRPRVSTSNIHLPEFIYGYKPPAFYVTYCLMYISIPQKPWFLEYIYGYKNPTFFTYFPTYIPLLHKLQLPPIIHNIPSITLHTSIQHSVKTRVKNQHPPQFTYFLRLTHIHCTMWVQYETSMTAWIQHIIHARIKSPGRATFLTWHRLTNLEYSTWPIKKNCLSINSTQLYSLPLDLLHEIYMCHLGLVHFNKLVPALAQLTKQNTIICAFKSY